MITEISGGSLNAIKGSIQDTQSVCFQLIKYWGLVDLLLAIVNPQSVFYDHKSIIIGKKLAS